jgi:hypothetical protein
MRKLLLALPVAAVLSAAGLLCAGLGQSLANTEIPDQATAAATATPQEAADTATGAWVETGRKPAPVVKSPKQKPVEPYPPGSRRRPR